MPVVGTGTKKALLISSPSRPENVSFPAYDKRILPGPLAFLLPLRFRLALLLSEAFFFSVPPLDGVNVCDCDIVEFVRWRSPPALPSMIEEL